MRYGGLAPLAAMSLAIASVLSAASPARTEELYKDKITQFGGPETKMRCIGELVTKGIPACRTRGLKIYCEDRYIRTCSEWATDFKQHAYYLKVDGPSNLSEAARPVLIACGGIALEAAYAAAVGVPSPEPAARIAAAAAAAPTAFYGCVTTKAAVLGIASQYKISIDHEEFW